MICPIAAGMVGVCLTGISLLHLGQINGRRAGLADDLLAFGALCSVPVAHDQVVMPGSASTHALRARAAA